ncbi:MAG: DUF805 domain-containing protein [Verrucomicrobia bacterium]|jgi:uncharacterized membrane protein YhaH (DUF805 family)|nr:DUF805 domain-containing protein [Verrucomicrobiota bacterium]
MNPISAYMNALRKCFDCRGKVSRGEYGMFLVGIIGIIVIFFIAAIISEEICDSEEIYDDMDITYRAFLWYWYTIFMWIFFIFGLTLPTTAAMARRLNDIGWPCWLGLVFWIPGIGWLFAILFGCIPGKKQENDPSVNES